MPEYLSPAVYVEEVAAGPRPIEGVSTSTTGMVGVTERGPENIPVLCTSMGDYRRIFGEDLPFGEFSDPSGRVHGHTFQAVKSYFENGGRRDFLVRVASPGATRAWRWLFDRGDTAIPASMILRAAPEDTGTAINTPRVYALQTAPALAVGDSLRVGDGSRSEYRTVTALGSNVHVALNAPLMRAHGAGSVVEDVTQTPDTGAYTQGTFEFDGEVTAGETVVNVTALGAAGDAATLLGLPGSGIFEFGSGERTEYRLATAAADLGGGVVELTLAEPLAFDHADNDPVTAMDLTNVNGSQVLETAAGAGEALVYLDAIPAGDFPIATPGRLVVIEPGTPNAEVRMLSTLGDISFDLPAYADYPAGTRADLVTMADDDRTVAAGASQTVLTLDRVDGLAVGMEVSVDGNPPVIIDNVDADLTQITTRTDALPAAPAGGEALVPADKALTADADIGVLVIALDNRLGLGADDV
ncbi:MAG: hypothetical protein ACR2OY_03755, partial [Boseongicola sp.]